MVLYEVIAKLKIKNGVSFDEKGEYVLLKDPIVVVEDTGVQHGNVEFGFMIKKELLQDEKEMLKNILKIQQLDRTRLQCLRKVEKGKLIKEIGKANELLKKIKLKDIKKDHDLLYQGATLVTEIFEKNKTQVKKKQLWWKRRIENQVTELNKDLGRLNALQDSKIFLKHQDNLQKR